ncbi:MAG: histidine phosphatase family protein [Gammaproteobacteria bacterium]|nr:histidine phosphatase family protein [Gammaproteobacteria bacterium]
MREKEKSTRVIFVRHGETDFPLDRLYCDDAIESPPLNKAGLAQAEAVALSLSDIAIDAIYASPAQRTQMTAKAIADQHGLDIVTSDTFLERRFGVWDGLYFDAVEKKYPEGYVAWKVDPLNFSPEGGETITDLLTRVKGGLDAILSACVGETIVVVAHVGSIRVALADALQMPLAGYRQLRIDYTSRTAIDYGGRQDNIIYVNRV